MNRQHSAESLGLPPFGQARVALAYARPALDEAAACGLDASRLGLPSLAADPLPANVYIELLHRSSQLSNNASFGLSVGARMRTANFVAYGAVLLSCENFGSAIAQTRRFEGLAHDLGRSELGVEGSEAHYVWHCPWLSALDCRQLCESVMASIHAFGTWLAQRPLPLHWVGFPHACPDEDVRRRTEACFGAPVRYGMPVTCASFSASLLAEPIPTADPALFPLLERHAADLLALREKRPHGMDDGSLAAQVRRLIIDRLAHDGARMADVASALKVSARTLQRRLAEEGTPFQSLLERARRELADEYLRNGSMSLTEIALSAPIEL